MQLLSFWMRDFFIILYTLYILKRSLNIKDINIKTLVLILISSAILAILLNISITFLTTLHTFAIIFILLSIMVSYIFKFELEHALPYTLLSAIVSLFFSDISFFISSIVFAIFSPNIAPYDIACRLLSVSIQLIFIYSFFKIKRFRNRFLFSEKAGEKQ